MVAIAEHTDGGETTLQLEVDDGTTFGGVVMAAMLEQCWSLEETPPGLVMPDELFEFDRLVDVCRERFSGSLRLEEERA
ncbi:MAG: hypothetical protein ABEK29_03185 [Bradymonadaceae bacterium]